MSYSSSSLMSKYKEWIKVRDSFVSSKKINVPYQRKNVKVLNKEKIVNKKVDSKISYANVASGNKISNDNVKQEENIINSITEPIVNAVVDNLPRDINVNITINIGESTMTNLFKLLGILKEKQPASKSWADDADEESIEKH